MSDTRKPGRLVTLEGIEGAGKSTVAKFICAWLARRSIPTRLTREPGGTPLAETLRAIVLGRDAEPISAVCGRELAKRQHARESCGPPPTSNFCASPQAANP